MTEQAPQAQHDTQATLQEVVRAVVETHSGDDLDTVTSAINEGLAAAGIPEQPEKWTRDTASEIVEGRHVVVDRTLGTGSGGE